MGIFTLETVNPRDIDVIAVEATRHFRMEEITLVIANILRYAQISNTWDSITYEEYLANRYHILQGRPNIDLVLIHRYLISGGYIMYTDGRFAITDRLIYTLRGCVDSDVVRHD